MTREELARAKERIVDLAKSKTTGTPCDLAIKLGVSKRTVKRLVKQLRDEGLDIAYDNVRMSYVLNPGVCYA